MKVKRLIIKNIGMIADTTIELNKPLILFFGEIMQGKTTILNAVKFCFGGSFPTDIIRHGEDKASVTFEFEGGSISRKWYIGKDDKTKSKPIVFIRDGKEVKDPVFEIRKLVNPYLLDQDYLRKMSELERDRYFTELFEIDTSDIDREYKDKESEAKDLRIKIKAYGDIDLTEYKLIDVSALKTERARITDVYKKEFEDTSEYNRGVTKHNLKVEQEERSLQALDIEISELQTKLSKLTTEREERHKWFNANPVSQVRTLPENPDTSEIDAKISNAAANDVRVEQYQKNLKRAGEKKADGTKLSKLENRQREIKKEKVAKLATISETCGIDGLEFNEDGRFLYMGTQAGMLSTSQIMKLSSELSALYPEGFGIDLIDRGESLGKSIYEFVDRAKEENKTILATIVGEEPAEIPENVGVFVVDNGEVKQKTGGEVSQADDSKVEPF